MRFRKLRIAWSMFWDMATVLLIVLWARSYWTADDVKWRRVSTDISFTSFRGSVGAFWYQVWPDSTNFEYESWEIGPNSSVSYGEGSGRPVASYLCFSQAGCLHRLYTTPRLC